MVQCGLYHNNINYNLTTIWKPILCNHVFGVNLYSSYTLLQINGREHEGYGEVLNVINKLTIMIMMHNSFHESIINEHK
jgi:hypothetical protein